MKPYFGLRGQRLNHATIGLVAFPAFFCWGWNQAATGGVLTLESFVHTFPSIDTTNTSGAQEKHNALIQGTAVGMYNIGGMLGALSCIIFGDWLGRRWSIFIASVLISIGSILLSSSFSLGQFIVGRIILGLGSGALTVSIPVWQSEISRPVNRGRHVVSEGIFVGLGLTISLWVDLGMYFTDPNTVSWRLPLALPVLFSLVVMTFVFTMPESPRWLLKRGRVQEAREVIAILEDTDIHSATVTSIIKNVEESLSLAGSGTIFDMFKLGNQRTLNRTCLAVTLQLFHTMCGVNVITFYATKIFQENLMLSATNSRILAAAAELCQPIGASVALFTIDRFGRRKLLLVAATGMMLSMAILAGTTSNPNDTGSLIAAAVFLFIFNFFFPIGFLGIPYLYITEVSPLHVRVPITALAVGTNWIFNFLIAEVTPIGFDTIGYKYWIIYAVINAVIIPTIYFCYPETMGFSLEQMDAVFEQSKNIFDPPRVAWKMRRQPTMINDVEEPQEKSKDHNESQTIERT